uniref:Uncharacterized protein n=1 Tax=Rhizophora mucronata TaxID=61149 RepID=A0A2P2KIV5_RHIMU
METTYGHWCTKRKCASLRDKVYKLQGKILRFQKRKMGGGGRVSLICCTGRNNQKCQIIVVERRRQGYTCFTLTLL